MLLNLISWLWILGTAFCVGFGVLYLVKRSSDLSRMSLDSVIVWGLCVITVYAQFFSLFYKVGQIATIVLGIFSLLILLLLRKEIFQYVLTYFRQSHLFAICVVCLVVGGLFLWLSSGYATHDDTILYHAQMIRWLEEYGVVKGLGNLHNRFAYNSAFFSLQALYSLKFATNQSLHSVNSLVAVIFSLYGILTLSVWRKETLKTSDLLKLGLIIYLARIESLYVLSSPGSDILTMSLILYLSAKWMELVEEECQDIVEYGLLCLLAVWAVTLKLSAGLMVLLALYPAVQLLKEHRWKTTMGFIVSGVVILFPFLARNVIISGYLLYPYATIDLFDVDWKMPFSVVDYDRIEIMAWGRGMRQADQYQATFSQWFPAWYRNLSTDYRILFWINLFCIVVLAAIFVYKATQKKISFSLLIFFITSAVQLGMWFFTAPLTRYGGAYLHILPAIALGIGISVLPVKRFSYVIAGFVLLGVMFCVVRFDHRFVAVSWKRPQEYFYVEYRGVEWEGLTIYVPSDGTQISYHVFPGTTGEYRLSSIELRGESLKDGFRVKEEYKDVPFTTSGPITLK